MPGKVPFLTGALAATVLVAGCGSSHHSAATTATTASGGGGTASGHSLTATESEYKIVLSSASVAPGTYSIDVVNKGSIVHALAIDGPGVSNRKSDTISGGDSTTMTVKLARGTYDVYCPLPGHKALGMDTKLVVS